MRRALIVFVSVLTVLGLSATAAQASPAPPTVQEERARTLTVKVKPKYGKRPASFTTAEAAKRQDPPMGGCDWSDIRGEVTGYYLDGALTSTQSSWSSKVFCATTAPGQSMAGIIVDSTEWLNGRNVAAGQQFTCTNCNLGNSTGANIGGPSASGTYWWSGTIHLMLPAGWVWTGLPSGCVSETDRMIACAAYTETGYLPPTYP